MESKVKCLFLHSPLTGLWFDSGSFCCLQPRLTARQHLSLGHSSLPRPFRLWGRWGMGSPAPTTAGSELLHLLLLVPLNPLYICQDNLLCQFSIASITNYHKFWDLIQIYYITVLYVRSLTCISLDLEQGVGRAAFPSGSSRKESSFQRSPAFLGSWPLAPSSKPAVGVESSCHLSLTPSPATLFHFFLAHSYNLG